MGPKFALTGLAAIIAEVTTFPIDACKTRMQLTGISGATAGPRLGAFSVIASLARDGALYTGVSAAICRQIPYSGVRISIYEFLRPYADSAGKRGAGNNPLGLPAWVSGGSELASKMALGAAAGASGQLVAVPCDLVKVRMQADARAVAAGALAAPRYRSFADALFTIARLEGARGLWTGTLPALQRAALVNLGELATYDTAKAWALSKGWFDSAGDVRLHFLSAGLSGLTATIASTPADVVKTRLMSQNAAAPQYRGFIDCVVKSVRAEGPGVLYRGFFPTWARLGPWQCAFWLSYEQLRLATGLGGF